MWEELLLLFLFHSKAEFFTRFDVILDLVILPYFYAPGMEFGGI